MNTLLKRASDFQIIIRRALVASFIALALYICFFQLGSGFFENWDEAWYADVTRTMLRNHNPFVLYWNQVLFLDKTPLNFWFNALFSLPFGVNEISIRLTSAISGFLVIAIVTYYTLRRWGALPAIAAFSVIALNNVFIWRTRTGNLDALASLLVVLIFLTLLSKLKYRLVLLGVLFGLMYLQKATLVAYPFVLFALHELLYHRKHIKEHIKQYLLCGLIFAGIVGLWLAIGYIQAGPQFVQYYLFKADQGVSRVTLSSFNTNYLSHLYYALQRRYIYLFVVGIMFLLAKARKAESLMIVLFASALVVQLSFTQRDNNWYLVPSMPFWGLVVGAGVHGMIQTVERIGKRQIVTVMFQALILVPILYISYKTFTVNIHAIIATRASIPEVKSAQLISQISKPSDAVLRLDHLYPTTIFYTDRKTYFHTTLDGDLLKIVNTNNVKWVVGKTPQVDGFLQYYQKPPTEVYPVGDETVVRL